MNISRTASVIAAAAIATTTLAACGGGSPAAPSTVTAAPSTVTVAAPAPVVGAPATQASVVAPAPVATGITIPDIPVGTNAEIAQSKLEALGLTNVDLASANPDYSNVFLPKNWTLVSIEPAPGTEVQASEPVVVKVTKP
ncbi:hypothetical protein ACTXG7_05295 [Mycolicibacterium sp. Dal123E01]|uniref:hypothetical protein n=1 Tax=Mycolicibacterium sp. Dal123E01 TaxID=3457578 RepID=UPI00403E8873